MKILYVKADIDPRLGGSVTAMKSMSRVALLSGDAVTIATTHDPREDDVSAAGFEGALVRSVPRSFPYTYAFSLRWLLLCIREIRRVDLVEIHEVFSFPALTAGFVSTLLRVPYVVRPHSSLDPYDLRKHSRLKGVLRPVVRFFIGRARALFFTSAGEKSRSDLHGAQVSLHVLPLAVHDRQVAGNRRRFRERYGVGREGLVVLFLGRIDKKKRVLELMEACSLLHRGGAHVHLFVAGDLNTAYGELVRERAAREDASWLRLVGHIDDQEWADAIAGADIFVLHSENENFGIAPVEAAIRGLPSLLSPNVDVAEALVLEGCATVEPIGSTDDLARALERIWRTDLEGLRQRAQSFANPFAEHAVATRESAVRRSLMGRGWSDS